MKIQEFAEQLEQRSDSAPFLEGLQTLRTWGPEELRSLSLGERGWVEWPPHEDSELRNIGLTS